MNISRSVERHEFLEAVRPEAAATGYRVEIESEYWRVQSRWERLAKSGSALPMQRQCWLAAFYASIGRMPGVEPILATVSDSLSARDLIGLPLVRVKRGRFHIVEFADHGLTYVNAPVLGPFVPRDLRNVQDIWRAIRRALPPTDVVAFNRMPVTVGGICNPLALLAGAGVSTSKGFRLELPDDWSGWRNGLDRRFRREADRAWRNFTSHDDAAFHFVTDSREGLECLFGLKRHQKASIVDLDAPYFLDQPAVRRFFGHLMADGRANDSVRLATLRAGHETVAALLMLVEDRNCTFVHLATAGGRWKICLPGRLIVERTIQALHQEGFRSFHFTVGDFPCRQQFGAEAVDLVDVQLAISWRALPRALVERVCRTMLPGTGSRPFPGLYG